MLSLGLFYDGEPKEKTNLNTVIVIIGQIQI